jgi:hypothetical protein
VAPIKDDAHRKSTEQGELEESNASKIIEKRDSGWNQRERKKRCVAVLNFCIHRKVVQKKI